MRPIERRRAVLLFLSALVIPAATRSIKPIESDSSLLKSAAGASEPAIDARVILHSGKANPVGTKDAPVDGKDGLPHAGPFVETGAERDRKKTKENGEEESVAAGLEETAKDQLLDKYPVSNDGVMDDPNRIGPKEGTRGTEGGVTEKSKDAQHLDKVPDAPKEVPPLPHSEAEKLSTKTSKADKDVSYVGEEEDKKLLEKPSDLPPSPHDIPPPSEPVPHKDTSITPEEGSLIHKNPKTSPDTTPASENDESAVIQPMHSLLLSFTMILFSEIGDKTFLVAALMAMRHDRIVVFTAAFSALITMTVLSAVLGHAVPTLIPKSITNFAAATLFLVFGTKMLLEARKMSPDEGVGEEMKEVEMELEEKEHQQRRMHRRSSMSPYILESGRSTYKTKSRSSTTRLPSPPSSPSSTSSSRSPSPTRGVMSFIQNTSAGINNLFSLLLSPAWVQTFVMTFLGEWGDRSQIATIAMAAGQDYWWVTAGALGGHAICTAAAVIGGRAIAGRVSLRVVTMGGAIAFLVFGCLYLFEAIY